MADQSTQPLNTPLPGDIPVPQPDPTVMAGPVLQTVAGQPPAPPQPLPIAGRRKEVVGAGTPTEAPAPSAEVPGQPAEFEPSPEMSPEVDKFVEKVEQQIVRPPAETVVAQEQPAAVPKTVSQPVVVLPATEKSIASGRKKDMTFSARWLAEWCVRQIRKFRDILVVYRENR